MRVPLSLLPGQKNDQYDLRRHAKNDFVYVERRKAVNGLPQAGVLANKLLKERLAPAGYFKVPHILYPHSR